MANGIVLGEFAVNPECVTSITDLTMLLRTFGFEHGAVISEFPRSWIPEVKGRAQQFEEPTRSAFRDKVDRLKTKAMVRLSRAAEGASWLDRTLASHRSRPFYGILHTQQVGDCQCFHTAINNDQFPYGLREGKALRNPEAMVDAVLPLVQSSERFTLIDPYFSPNAEYKEFVERLVNKKREVGAGKLYIDIHLEHDEVGEGPLGIAHINNFKHWAKSLPNNLEIKVRWWDDKKSGELHPRYLITERGGARFDRGFRSPDERRAAKERENDADICMMTEAFIKEIENRYSEKYQLLKRIHGEVYTT
jgi:hypothetical protein